MRDIGSLIFETPIQHDCEAGVEVRSLLPTEQLEEADGRLAVTDEDPQNPGVRTVKFWVDEVPSSPGSSRSHVEEDFTTLLAGPRDASRAPITPERRDRVMQGQENRGSQDFGGGVGYQENDDPPRGHIPESDRNATQHRGHNRSSPVRSTYYSRTPPEDQIPRGCSLHSRHQLPRASSASIDARKRS